MATQSHIIKLRKDSEFTAKLKIKKGKGYVTYFYNKIKIEDSDFMSSFNKEVLDHYVKQAELICRFADAILWSY